MSFSLQQTDSNTSARAGTLSTPHGEILTPTFMPVGTQGSVKTLHPQEVETEVGAQIILGNTYHLHLRPGDERIAKLGGLHQFTSWHKPILTDSGGFQVWSLAQLRKISEEGVRFQSHIDGSPCFLSPEKSMEIQANLGSDIAMLFDECPPWPCSEAEAEASLNLTLRWAKRCKKWVETHKPQAGNPSKNKGRQLHFGIVQGSSFAHLRQRACEELVDLDFPGYAIGGVSVGEPEKEMFAAIEHSTPHLPTEKPRYAMGLGTPPQMVEMIARGVDLFDCVMPTRVARNGLLFTWDGPLKIKNARWAEDPNPLHPNTPPSLQRFSRAYLHHLFKAGEMLACRIFSLHNLHFYLQFTQQARNAILEGRFLEWKQEFLRRYHANSL